MVYIIHIDEKIGRCQHYVGYTENLKRRLKEHLSGNNGSPLLNEANRRSIKWTLASVIESGDRQLEKKIKRQKNTKKWCPICNKNLVPFF